MGEKSSVTINTPGKASLKTTIPISMVRQFGINQGDLLDWSIAKMMVVRKVGQKLEQNIVPYEVIQEEREKNRREIKSGKKRTSRPTVA